MQAIAKKFPQNSLLAVAMGRLQAGIGDYTGCRAGTYRLILQRMEQRVPGYQVLSRGEIQLRLTLALAGFRTKQEALAEAEKAVAGPVCFAGRACCRQPHAWSKREIFCKIAEAPSRLPGGPRVRADDPHHEKARQYLDHLMTARSSR